jgi:hypothetical protein
MTKKSDPTEAAREAMAEAMAKFQQMGLKSMQWPGAEWMEKMSEMGSEWMHFLSERMQEDVEFQQKLLACKDASELHKLQADYVQTAIDQYTSETGRIIEMGSAAMTPDPKSGDK